MYAPFSHLTKCCNTDGFEGHYICNKLQVCHINTGAKQPDKSEMDPESKVI